MLHFTVWVEEEVERMMKRVFGVKEKFKEEPLPSVQDASNRVCSLSLTDSSGSI